MADIESIIQQMTLEEKAALCTGEGPWATTAEADGVPMASWMAFWVCLMLKASVTAT